MIDYPFTVGAPALPGNSQHTYMLDTTYIGTESTTLSTSARTTLGPSRALCTGKRAVGTILCTGQDVTCTFEILVGDNTWQTDPDGPGTAGVKTVTATVVFKFDWLPKANEYRIRITAGATGPTTLSTTLYLIDDRNAGV